VYKGWVQNLPASWKNKLISESLGAGLALLPSQSSRPQASENYTLPSAQKRYGLYAVRAKAGACNLPQKAKLCQTLFYWGRKPGEALAVAYPCERPP